MQLGEIVDGKQIIANFMDLVVLTLCGSGGFSVWNVKPNGNWWGERHYDALSAAVDSFTCRCKIAANVEGSEPHARV